MPGTNGKDVKSLSQEEKDRLRTLCKGNLFFLARGVLGYDEMIPRSKEDEHKFHLKVCRFIEKSGRCKLVCLPRGFFKTTICTVASAIWRTLREPGCSQLICCQKAGNAQKMVDEIRNHWDGNEVLRSLFPEMIPQGNGRWSGERADLPTNNQAECSYESAGIGTQLQSRHYDHIYADDLVVAQKDQTTGTWMQPSEEDIQKAIGWHQMTWGIMKDAANTTYTQIMTRWCPGDLFDHLVEEEPSRWDVLELAAMDDSGNPRFPQKYPIGVLEEIRESQGEYKFYTQYLNEPIASEDCLFQDKFYTYLPEELPEGFKKIYAAVDPAISKEKKAHYTAILVVGLTKDGRRYVLESVCKRGMTTNDIIDKLITLWKRWRFKILGVESVAYQEAVVDALEDRFKEEGGRLFRIQEFKSGNLERKDLRIRALQPSFDKGWWYISQTQQLLRTQLQEYPYGNYNDLLDALAYIHKMLPTHKGRNIEETPHKSFEPRTTVSYEEIMADLEKGTQNSMFDLQDRAW